MKKYVLFIFAFFLIPSFAHANVSITEVAWMGTEGKNGQYGEWIELYNDGDQAVDLTGWKINKTGDKLLIPLLKEIPSKSYFLVERATNSIPDPVSGIDDIAGTFGNNGLSNTGEDLVLLDDKGNEVQRLSFASKWPAGNADTKQTMQWNGSAWITASPTPKSSTEERITSGDNVSTESSQSSDQTNKDSQADTSSSKENEAIPPSPNKPYVKFDIPKHVYTGTENAYVIKPILEYNYQLTHGNFTWNFGDGTLVQQKILEPVSHTYQYPGTYTVSFSYKEDKEAYGVHLFDS